MSRHLWVYNVSLERKVGARTVTVVIQTESRHRPRRTTKNDRDEGDHRPLFKDTRCCDECIITSIFVLFLSLREPTKKKKKKAEKVGRPEPPQPPRVTATALICGGIVVLNDLEEFGRFEADEKSVF